MPDAVPNDDTNPGFNMTWNGDTPSPDTSKLDEHLDRNIKIMFAQLGIQED